MMSSEHLDLASDHDGTADTAQQAHSVNDVQEDGLNKGHSASDTDKMTQARHKQSQTGSACRCSQDPVFQIYAHFKSMQKLRQQRQTRMAREERKRHRRTEISSTVSVDPQSGRWLSLDLNSRQSASSRTLNAQNSEIESTNRNKANVPHEKTLSVDSINSPTLFLKSQSEHFKNRYEESDAKSSSQAEDSNRRLNKSRTQIIFNMPESELNKRNSPKTKIHWNNVPAGRVTPAHVPVITIDRNRLM